MSPPSGPDAQGNRCLPMTRKRNITGTRGFFPCAAPRNNSRQCPPLARLQTSRTRRYLPLRCLLWLQRAYSYVRNAHSGAQKRIRVRKLQTGARYYAEAHRSGLRPSRAIAEADQHRLLIRLESGRAG